jgi:hypothetical protein
MLRCSVYCCCLAGSQARVHLLQHGLAAGQLVAALLERVLALLQGGLEGGVGGDKLLRTVL